VVRRLCWAFCGLRVHSGTAPFSDGPYTRDMQGKSIKATGPTGWVTALSTAGMSVNLTSLSAWTLQAGLAALPPLAMMWQCTDHRQSASESIQEVLQ
jgi:hypothetical protein